MAFATVNAALTAAGAGKMQRLSFSKLMASVSVANVPKTLWKATGIPAAGVDPTVGAANGRALTKSTGGGFDFLNDAASGETTQLVNVGATSGTASTTGTLILCDRMADVNLDMTQATSAITGCDGTARMGSTSAPGDGGQLWGEVTTAFGVAVNAVTLTADSQVGGSATIPLTSYTSGAAIGNSINTFLWQPLNAAETAIRKLTNLTFTTNGGNTGAYNMCIVRPLAYLPLLTVSQYIERDFLVELPALSKVWDNACLFFIYVPAAAVTATIFGEVRVLAG